MDEEIPHLSGDTLASLCEFWLEEKKLEEDMSQLFEESWSKYCPMENWVCYFIHFVLIIIVFYEICIVYPLRCLRVRCKGHSKCVHL